MKKLYCFLERICGNQWFPLLFIPIAVCFLLLYSYTTSPLFPNEGLDSAVFKTMGLAILKGKIPYVDIFDHKGPILYFINALGQCLIPGRMGIFLLQVVGLSVALFYWFKTANLFVNKVWSFLSILITLFIFEGMIQEGNQCEEWMMYFFSIAWYYALYYIVKKSEKSHPLKYSILYGLCFGMAFFIRPSDAVAILGGIMTGLTILLIYKKEYKSAVFNALCFAVGFAVVAIPVISYFAYYRAVDEMMYGLIGFNKSYAGGISVLWESVLYSEKKALLLVFLCFVLLAYEIRTYRILLIVLLPALLFEWLLIGCNFYPHYYMVLMPFYLTNIVFIILLYLKKRKSWSLIILSIAILFVSDGVSILNMSILELSSRSTKNRLIPLTHGRAYHRIKNFYAETDLLLSAIPEKETDSIWNYNLIWHGGGVSDRSEFSIIWHKGLVQCNLITASRNDLLCAKDDITIRKPLWVLVDEDCVFGKDDAEIAFIFSNYDLVAYTDTTICKVELFHRK